MKYFVFTQHIPDCVETRGGDPRITFEFDSLGELLNHEYVKRFSKNPDFHDWSMSGNMLMAEYEDGFKWWVVGYIKPNLDLKNWEAKYRPPPQDPPIPTFEEFMKGKNE